MRGRQRKCVRGGRFGFALVEFFEPLRCLLVVSTDMVIVVLADEWYARRTGPLPRGERILILIFRKIRKLLQMAGKEEVIACSRSKSIYL